jgi:hypothetical protein
MRLEQRIGRVDRIGQRRVVHAFHLVAARTGETRILARLKARIAQAHADVGAPDPFGDDQARDIARAAILGRAGDVDPATDRAATSCNGAVTTTTPDLRSDAADEAHRIALVRSLSCSDEDDRARLFLEADGPWIGRAGRSAIRAALGHRILLIWRLAYEDGCGRIAESACVSTAVRIARVPRARGAAWLEDVLQSIDGEVRALIEQSTAAHGEAVERLTGAFTAMRLRREFAIAAHRDTAAAATFQPGLFDRRAERLHLDAMVERHRAVRDQASRVEHLSSSAIPVRTAPRLLLVFAP